MISIIIDPSSTNMMYASINAKIDGIKELLSPQTKKQLVDVAFSKSALAFVKKTNMIARSNKESFHHVYEWLGSGQETSRLFRVIKKNNSPGSASVYYRFNTSKKKAPISSILKVPGPTGKVVTRSGVFKNKAEVMESGSEVSFITRRTIAIPSGKSISFIPPGKNVRIKSPGGPSVAGSFNRHFLTWWSANFPNSLEREGILNKLEISVAKALSRDNAGKDAARSAISTTLGRYKVIGSVI